ncbi:glycosyltransferase [Marinobacterium rhizophilum]|uniref:Glycosyltransferase n=1 Tax=Marinobacterium rhizophilum TaxID=420402 RepID=A0ABY5HEC7_9GAMM|nr:glycosyltransferase [Marinobacterium rhizophilum]UTW10630.1 glycosyltransferase [Marinobacterium rhizophilum]
MKVLFVFGGNSGSMPFIGEQADSLKRLGVIVDDFKIIGRGFTGYLKNISKLYSVIEKNEYDLIHAHYGLSGLLSVLQRKIPVVITYHGSDINKKYVRILSLWAAKLSDYNIFVSDDLFKKANSPRRSRVIPCGVDVDLFKPLDKNNVKSILGFDLEKHYILFASSFDNPVKNYALAKKAIEAFPSDRVELVELKGWTREQVPLLMNACEALLMTSFTEGSPQVVKEAMACNLPVVSTNVGDVKAKVSGLKNCYITECDAHDIVSKLNLVILSEVLTNSRCEIVNLSLDNVALEVQAVYKKVKGLSDSI